MDINSICILLIVFTVCLSLYTIIKAEANDTMSPSRYPELYLELEKKKEELRSKARTFILNVIDLHLKKREYIDLDVSNISRYELRQSDWDLILLNLRRQGRYVHELDFVKDQTVYRVSRRMLSKEEKGYSVYRQETLSDILQELHAV